MKSCSVENFQQLADAITRVEQTLGLLTDNSLNSVHGRLNQFKQGEDGALYYYDAVRNKWLSVYRNTYTFDINHKNVSGARFLNSGNVPSNLAGYKLPHDSTILSISITSATTTIHSVFYFVLNDAYETPIHTITMSNGKHILFRNLDIDITSEDILKCYLVCADVNPISYPTVVVELAGRIT